MGRKTTGLGYLLVALGIGFMLGRGSDPPTPPEPSSPKQQTTPGLSGNAQPTARQPPTAPVPAFTPKTMYVDATRLNVRSGPGIDNKQVWTLKQDEAVRVVARDGDWYQVRSDRYDGWVHGGYLTPNPAPVALVPPQSEPSVPQISDDRIRRILIERSISLYRGSCPCPYNTMRNGRRCGGNSAYSRPGGASPLCYPADVSDAMVRDYRARL